jgi:hypothetical protein
MKTEEASLGVTEDPSGGCGGTKTREAIGIVEATVFLHERMIPVFPARANTIPSSPVNIFRKRSGSIYPLVSTKSLIS